MQTFPDTISFPLDSSAISDRGLSEKRPQNEDSYLEMPQIGIFAVADGVGGAEAGEVASQMAVEILGEAFANRAAGSDAEIVMRIALERANVAIHQMSNDLTQLSKMATTIVALHLDNNVATIGHVGDSRIYRSLSDGSLVRETEDHSMVADEVRAGRMTEEQAENHPGKNIINRALGAEHGVDVELKTIMIDAGSTFLLCSDGVTRHIRDEELEEILASGAETSTICSHLRDLCYERGAEDNLTAVVVRSSVIAHPPEVLSGPETDLLILPDSEEDTIASSRFASASDDDLLEIETSPSVVSPVTDQYTNLEAAAEQIVLDEADEIQPSEFDDTVQILEQVAPFSEPQTEDSSVQVTEPSPEVVYEPSPTEREPFSTVPDEPSFLGRLVVHAAVLILGSLIGLAVYHFALRQPTPPPATEQLTEMRSQNVALGAFEDNRRAVDADPALYLSKVPAPGDAEDLYLLGRAQFLTGDFVKARTTLLEARKRISETDTKNRRVIESDIAVFLSITNDTTIQSNVKKELESSKAATNSSK